jgi:hypothetical protein
MTHHVEAPLVSIIITTYNRADLLRDAIDSALGQWYPKFEVIVIDDGSSDGTPEVLRSYGSRIVAHRQANAGYANARNVGLRRARGEYVAWLDSDDVFAPEKTALQVDFLERHADVVLVSTDFEAFDARGKRNDTVRTYYRAFRAVPGGADAIYPTTEIVDPESVGWLRGRGGAPVRVRSGPVAHALLNGSFVHPPTVMMRREAAQQAGELDETLPNSVEYPFLFRLARLGAFAFIDHPLIRYRFSPGQFSGDANSESMAIALLRIMQELALTDADIVQAAPALYRRRLAMCHFNVARVFAEIDRKRAFRASLQAVRHGFIRAELLNVWARMLLPSSAVEIVRRLKRRGIAWKTPLVVDGVSPSGR